MHTILYLYKIFTKSMQKNYNIYNNLEGAMKIGIIGDSSCDFTDEIKAQIDAKIAPLRVTVEDRDFIDDDSLNLEELLEAMRESKKAASSACPSPAEFAELMEEYDVCFVVTLSSKLSGSYNSALVAKDMVLEEHPEKKIHVVDSKSASSGQTLLALAVAEMVEEGKTFEEIAEKVEEQRKTMRTVFVLGDLDNFIKNGRLSKVAGLVANMLSIKPVLADDGQGEIIMLDKIRGTESALKRLTERVAEFSADKDEKTVKMVLSHCNNPQRAQQVKDMILTACPAIQQITVVNMHGLSSMYANEGGIIVAF